ncbi:capsular polysaccharide export protein, LipB/KpsS family [Microbulbifer sp. PSTR4-B]|uniref:capsular polysaccharide export protein, LipB/KpsS family n=1 Tax=Microbulbifer sp. PSTR4-B TaxID=3243396 RepID=UPI004039EC40
MRILIYEPMPDIQRADIILAIARKESKLGNNILLLVEEEVQLLFRNHIKQPHSVNCTNIIKAKIATSEFDFIPLPRNKALAKRFEASPQKTLNDIRRYRANCFQKVIESFKPEKIIIWSGLPHYQQDFIDLARNINPNQKFSFLEAGWLPQSGTYYEDPLGVNAQSSISITKPRTISPKERQNIIQWKLSYRNKFEGNSISDNGYVFIPLQLETDTNITKFSPFSTMKEFLEWAESRIDPSRNIIARQHPLDRKSTKNLLPGNSRIKLDNKTPLHQLIAKSNCVLGINSTVLLESLIYEKPIYAIGDGVFSGSKAIYKINLQEIVPINHKYSIDKQEELLNLLLGKQNKLSTSKNSYFSSLVSLKINHRYSSYSPFGIAFSIFKILLKSKLEKILLKR